MESDPRNATIKLVYVRFTDGAVAAACLPRLHTVLPTAYPVPATSAPPQATAAHIDATPTPANAPPLNCRVRTCPHWGYGQPCFLPNASGLQQAANHGRTFHSDLYASLPADALASINWFRCVPSCPAISYSVAERDTHAAGCNFVAEANSKPPAQPAPLAPGPHRTGPYAGIVALCPASKQQELASQIANGVAVADLQSLLIVWLNEAQAAPIAHGDH